MTEEAAGAPAPGPPAAAPQPPQADAEAASESRVALSFVFRLPLRAGEYFTGGVSGAGTGVV